MAWFLGIDVGSTTSKGVLTEDGKLKAYRLYTSGIDYRVTIEKLISELLSTAGLTSDALTSTVYTGHVEGIIPGSARHFSDILCCTKGIHRIFPEAKTVIDIQAQSSQVIRLDEKGHVTDYATNDICASGSGYFIDIIANVLNLEIQDVGSLSLKSKNPVSFTTGCAIFGESEAISKVSEGIPVEDILAGVFKMLASKISTLANKVGWVNPCAISGGGGLNHGLIKSLEDTGFLLQVPFQPQIVNAMGAAFLAEEQLS